jgi:pimeloyl-ACP methyl ester carboxylesterase
MVLGHSIALAAERITAPIEGMHMAISGRWWERTGRPGRAVGLVHDTVSTGVYGSVRLGAKVLGAAINHRVSADSPVSLKAQTIVNGLWGDDLGCFGDDLEISMEIRGSEGDVLVDESGLTDVPPDVAPRLILLIHGLFESEICWRGNEQEHAIMEILESRSHLTVLNVRYNSGRRISDNGELLASMLDALSRDWPVRIESLALVGNSMGGLLIRSACAVAEQQDQTWLMNVSDIVTIATPHRGTPIEQGVDIVSSVLSLADSTRPLGEFLDSRSEGIKDLRDGTATVNRFLLFPSIDHHFIATVVTSNPASPIGAVLGDLVVRPASASMGRDRSSTSVTVIGGTNHFKSLMSPVVIDRVVGCVDHGRPEGVG